LREPRVRAGPRGLDLLARGRDLPLQRRDPPLLLRLQGEQAVQRGGRGAVVARRRAADRRHGERGAEERRALRDAKRVLTLHAWKPHFDTTWARRFLAQAFSSWPWSKGRSLPYEIVVRRLPGMP